MAKNHLEHFNAALKVGCAHMDDAVKAARANECRVQDILAVGCRHHNHLAPHADTRLED